MSAIGVSLLALIKATRFSLVNPPRMLRVISADASKLVIALAG